MQDQSQKQSVFVSGANGGIGAALARALRAEGAQVFLFSRNEDALSTLASELECPWRAGDASDFQALEEALAACLEQFGSLSAVVNCAGSILLKPAHLCTQEEFSQIVSDNLQSAFSTVRASGKLLDDANVLLFSTAATRQGLPNHEAIVCAKAGVEALCRSAAATYASKKLRFNCIAPGLTRTPLSERITSNPQALEYSTSLHALGRIGEIDDIISAARWLIHPAQNWVTAQCLGVDGGLSSVRAR